MRERVKVTERKRRKTDSGKEIDRHRDARRH